MDTKTVLTADGNRTYRFFVIGDPCHHRDKMRQPGNAHVILLLVVVWKVTKHEPY